MKNHKISVSVSQTIDVSQFGNATKYIKVHAGEEAEMEEGEVREDCYKDLKESARQQVNDTIQHALTKLKKK